MSQIDKVVKETGAIPFDAPDVDLGHHEGKCSFETIVERYGLKEKGLLRLDALYAWCRLQVAKE